MPPAPATIGPYRIERELGRGGMGVVYLGHDPRLDRAVAIKALPDMLADDADRLGRFTREAKTLAALSHPGIAGIYGLEQADGRQYLVLEYVEGETLDARLARGPLPIDEALAIADRIAAALEAAHEKGIVHRDLKPGNVMVTPDGGVKVLDFGLARAPEPDSVLDASPDSPTFTSPGHPAPTIPGVIMGTAGYMSPEQARGKPVDKRSDIFSFGCVLYEVLTREPPFVGETISDLIGAVLHTDVDLDRLPPAVPLAVRRALARCLERDKAARYRDIGDVRLDLRSFGNEQGTAVESRSGIGRLVAVGAAACAAGALMTALAMGLSGGGDATERTLAKRFGIGGFNLAVDPYLGVTISRDGRHLAIRSEDEAGNAELLLRSLGSTELIRVDGSDSARMPFFSPDGRYLAFYVPRSIKVAPVGGGAAWAVTTVPGGFAGGVWAGDTIIFSGQTEPALYRVPAAGGQVEKIPIALGESVEAIVVTSMLPGGDVVLCTVRREGRYDVAAVSLADGELRIIEENAFEPVYAASGHILYQQGESGPLMAVPFDDRQGVATGAPFPVINNIGARNGYQVRLYGVASDGTLVYISPLVTQDTSTLVWRDPSGGREVITRVARMADLPRLSHDGTRVAFRTRAPECDIWVHDLRRNSTTRLTSEGDNHGIVWAGADDRIATFQRSPTHNRAVWLPSDGAGPGVPLSPQEVFNAFLFDVSSDERYALVSEQREGSSQDVSVLDLADKRLRPLLGSRFDERGATLSPDGRLVAYVSNESGHDEVYLQPFPALASRVQVSIGGGSEPAWSRDGHTLYFRNGDALFSAAVDGGASPVVAVPVRLFEGTFALGVSGMRGYDVRADGRRFLMIERDTATQQGDSVEVVVNFFSELEKVTSPAN